MLAKLQDGTPAAGDPHRLTTLLEVGRALASTVELRPALRGVLETLERRRELRWGALLLLRPEPSEDDVEVAGGGSSPASRRAGALLRRVCESGRPLVVPRVGGEPLLGGAPGAQLEDAEEETLLCAPVLVGRKRAGALGLAAPFRADRDYHADARFLELVASLVGQQVRVHRLVESERRRLVDENAQLRQELKERYEFSSLVGTSGPMRQAFEQIAQVARTNTTVLIRGESGTGKELIAHAIHYNSVRAKKPLVKVSCAALPQTLIESELFGYEKGAFTGADAAKKGRFQLAEGGTLFLDEIGELDLPTQVKLLRVLQEREYERLGGTETHKANVRVIAATHRDLEQAITERSFREDLYYRLNVFSIFVPPLRERRPDILLLADHFLEKYAREHGKAIRRISTPAIDMLVAYHWPGNVRELENAMERAVLVCDGSVVHGHHLPPTLQTAEASGTQATVPFEEAVATFEKDLLQDALKTARGNCAKAARFLQTTERIVTYKVRKYGLDPRRFR